LEKENLSEQKKILAGKNSLSKKVFSLSKKGFPTQNPDKLNIPTNLKSKKILIMTTSDNKKKNTLKCNF
jgi:hypothetical protein